MNKKIYSKIIISIFVFVSIFSFNKAQKAEALLQTMDIGTPTVSQGFNGQWRWKFNITTQYVPDNTTITVQTQELIKILPTKTIKVTDNSAVYDTGDALTSGTPYIITFTLNTNPSITKKYTGTPGPTNTSTKPEITTFSPSEGKIGDTITITGKNFIGTKSIFFGPTAADITSATINSTEIKVAVPQNATNGKIAINNIAGEGISSQVFKVTGDPQGITGQDNTTSNGDYNLLAPIGTFAKAPTNIGEYFNIIFKIAIGLCAVLAVIMIVIGGIQYMGDESIFAKTEAKKSITSAIFGLIIALGAYALLNTINPDLLGGNGVNIKQVSAEIVDLPDAGDGEIDPGFAKQDYKYSTDASVSTGVTNAVAKLKSGWEISSFKVYPNERMGIILKKGNEYDNSNVIDVRSGVNGFSEVGKGVSKDKKTPKGNWKILNIKTSPNGAPVYNKEGSNMGASFWLLSPTVNGERGIGMHGNKNGTLSRTYGCVRLKNSDILALLPYVHAGIPVIINN